MLRRPKEMPLYLFPTPSTPPDPEPVSATLTGSTSFSGQSEVTRLEIRDRETRERLPLTACTGEAIGRKSLITCWILCRLPHTYRLLL
jgi:hypothetical protein